MKESFFKKFKTNWILVIPETWNIWLNNAAHGLPNNPLLFSFHHVLFLSVHWIAVRKELRGEELTEEDQRKWYSQLDRELRPHPEDRWGLVDPKTQGIKQIRYQWIKIHPLTKGALTFITINSKVQSYQKLKTIRTIYIWQELLFLFVLEIIKVHWIKLHSSSDRSVHLKGGEYNILYNQTDACGC